MSRLAFTLSVLIDGAVAEVLRDLDLPTVAAPDASPVNERSTVGEHC
ncbi:MAG: hypothetical protein H7840_11205 [Alphaproteobacteria bacterium]